MQFVTEGSTIHHLYASDVVDALIGVPPIGEQRAIANALADVDAWISGLDNIISKKKAVMRASMDLLLSQRHRLEIYRGPWRCIALGQIARIRHGKLVHRDKRKGGHYPFFVRSEEVERINSYSYDCEAILVPGEGDIENICHYYAGRFDVHKRVFAVTGFSPDVCCKYVFYYMKKYFGNYALQHNVKATVNSIRMPTISAFKIRVPTTLEEQLGIAEILYAMENEIVSLEALKKKYFAVKTGMLQVLLTGAKRVV